MWQTNYLRKFAICSCAIGVLAGCNPGTPSLDSSAPVATSPTPKPPVTPPPTPHAPGGTTPPQSITQPSVYVEDDSHSDFYRILVYSASATGSANFTFAMGDRAHSLSKVSVDAAGYIYVLSSDGGAQTILEYSPTSPLAAPVRSFPVGSGTKIPAVLGLSVSRAGKIFVADGTGLSVFSATANGDADPERHITNSSAPGTVAVDSKDNAYLVNRSDTPIVVYGPTQDGNTPPIRALGGDMTQLDGGYIGGITTDTTGNLYVACICRNVFGVLEFAASANGNAAPIRIIAGPQTGMYPYFASLGVAVDSAGYLYVNAIKANATPPCRRSSSSHLQPAETLPLIPSLLWTAGMTRRSHR